METLNSFSSLTQALCAVVALVVSVVALLQNKKIQELVDMVTKLTAIASELQNQTAELSKQSLTFEKRLSIEKSLTMPSRMPVFEKNGCLHNVYQHKYEVYLHNIGKRAYNISAIQEAGSEAFYDLTPIGGNVESGNSLTIQIVVKKPEAMMENPFRITLNSKNSNGYSVTRFITQVPGTADYILTDPTDYL